MALIKSNKMSRGRTAYGGAGRNNTQYFPTPDEKANKNGRPIGQDLGHPRFTNGRPILPSGGPVPITPKLPAVDTNRQVAPPIRTSEVIRGPQPPVASNPMVDPNATVSGQMNKIMASGSPLLQRARTNAAKAANRRGTLNSSMALQAGEEAALSAALPMAQQDAATYAQRGASDQGFRQQVGGGEYSTGLIGANLRAQQALQTGQQGFAGTQAALDRGQQLNVLGQQQQFAGTQAELDRGQQKDILGQQQGFTGSQAELDRGQQKDILGQQQQFAGSQSALDRGQQLNVLGQQQQFAGSQSALDRGQQKDILGQQQQFAGSQSALDRGQQLNVLGQQQQFAGTQAELDRGQQKDILGQQQDFAGTQAELDRGQQKDILGQQQGFAGTQAELDRDQQLNVLGQQQDFAGTQAELGREQQRTILGTQQEFAATQAGYDRAQQLEVLGQNHTNAMQSAQTMQEYQQANMQMQTDLQERLAVLGYEQNIGLSKLQNEFDMGKIGAQVYANTQGQYLQSVNELIKQTQISVGELQAAPDISTADKQKMMTDQGVLLKTHLGLYKNLYENAATWSSDWIDFPDN